MKFDFIIGNPPYQVEQNGRMLPIYHTFMDEVFEIGDVCELITPGRFLFNAGQTGADWNNKILNNPHFKVLDYEPDSKKYFAGVDIEGGVAITLHDKSQTFGAVGIFVADSELRSALNKVLSHDKFEPLTKVIFTSTRYDLKAIFDDHPEYKQYVKHDGKDSQIDTNAFAKMPIFIDHPSSDSNDYIRILGRYDNQRAYWWVRKKYMADSGSLFKYKVFVPTANGSGAIGKVIPTTLIGTPVIGEPGIGSTQSFLTVGVEDSLENAQNIMKYIKGKFSRAMLGTLKITQHNPPVKWKNVPLQDFSVDSDIDWSKSIHEIDLQLYEKYKLNDKEIEFIETRVKEME